MYCKDPSSLGHSKLFSDCYFYLLCCISLLGLPWQDTIDWVASTTEISFLTVLEAGSPKSRFQPIRFLVRALFLACRQTPCCVLIRQRERVSSLVSYNTNHLDQGPTPMTWFSLNYLCKGPVSKYSHIGGWGFNVNFVGTHLVHNMCLHRKNQGHQCSA